jgi:hypothetical protein
MSLAERFETAAEEAKQLKTATNDEKLTLYKYYKQVKREVWFSFEKRCFIREDTEDKSV